MYRGAILWFYVKWMKSWRKLERKYNKTKLAVNKERLHNQRKIYNDLPTRALKQDYFKTKIETGDTSKDLYKLYDNLLKREYKSTLPSHDCIKDLADKCVTHFNDRICNIRKQL